MRLADAPGGPFGAVVHFHAGGEEAVADGVGVVPAPVGSGLLARLEQRVDEGTDDVTLVAQAALGRLTEANDHRAQGSAAAVQLIGLQRVA